MNPSERASRARLASYRSWANTSDPTKRTQPGRDRFDKRFEDEVDPDRILPESERLRRAEAARRAYFTALGRKSGLARAKGRPDRDRPLDQKILPPRKDSHDDIA